MILFQTTIRTILSHFQAKVQSSSSVRRHHNQQFALFFLIRTSNFRPAGLFLISWRFQPHIVLKLFLFPDFSKQWVTRFFFIRTSKISFCII